MARKKEASFQNEYLVGYKTGPDELQMSSTVIALTPSEAEAKFLSATSLHSDTICNILKTGELVII